LGLSLVVGIAVTGAVPFGETGIPIGAEAELGDFHSGPAEEGVLHGFGFGGS